MNILYFIGFNFIIYSFLGWVIEELYCFIINRKFKKDGFLKGPIKPMYGISMTALVLSYYVINIRGLFLAILCFIIPTSVEYISGYLMKQVFNEIYWSYKNVRFNIQGYICLKFSSYWMALSFIGVYYLQPVLNDFYSSVDEIYLKAALIIISSGIIFDFISTVKGYYYKLYMKA